MIRCRRRLFFILAGGAMMAPLFAFGHACEYLVARLEIQKGTVHLEITADYGGNPLIEDEEAARQALKTILQANIKGQLKPLEDLAPVTLEHRSQWDPDAPTAFSPPLDGQPHQLLTAIWRWKANVDDLMFAVPKGNAHDVLLWTGERYLPGKEMKWMMMIEGDSTPKIVLREPWKMRWDLLFRIGLGVVALLAWSMLQMRKTGKLRKT